MHYLIVLGNKSRGWGRNTISIKHMKFKDPLREIMKSTIVTVINIISLGCIVICKSIGCMEFRRDWIATNQNDPRYNFPFKAIDKT